MHRPTVSDVREHTCDQCQKSFLSNKDLRRHIDGVHLKKKIVYPGQRSKKTNKKRVRKGVKKAPILCGHGGWATFCPQTSEKYRCFYKSENSVKG